MVPLMITWLARQFHYYYGFLKTHDSPRQLALGLAFGVVLGLTPKGNLLALLVGMLLFSFRVNLQMGMLTGLGVSFIAALFDPVTERIGYGLLTAPPLRSTWTALYNLPLVPWTGFNNTVVLGSFVLGWMLFYPAYRVSLPVFQWRADRQSRAAKDKTQGGPDASAELDEARRLLRRRNFQRFIAEIESIPRHRSAA
jgi:uncharacterized protein (TIGR03546 family)